MDPAQTLIAFNAPVGGLAANDANNAVREHTVVSLINNSQDYTDPAFDPLKTALNAWLLAKKAELGFGPHTPVRAVKRGGRRYNWDFDLIIGNKTIKVEFKYGATSVGSLPEFYNPAANKDFHQGESYATFFYNGYLPQVCAIYGVPLDMTEKEYFAKVHGTSKKSLFAALYEAEKNGTEQQKAEKKVLADQSIAAWLEQVKDKTDISAITQSFKDSQQGKHFMLYKDGQFYSDKIHPEELITTSVVGVRRGKYLVLQSAKPGTTHEMLLRWKNHAGILYPAWQISMKRA